ncbi:hypothetical protein BYT27DRAFT_7184968 [Phlegmacium glaucopus]|nr:hypothetical protein BYT27DRAFT_7184968 [Phlegmacium glaucopus]
MHRKNGVRSREEILGVRNRTTEIFEKNVKIRWLFHPLFIPGRISISKSPSFCSVLEWREASVIQDNHQSLVVQDERGYPGFVCGLTLCSIKDDIDMEEQRPWRVLHTNGESVAGT